MSSKTSNKLLTEFVRLMVEDIGDDPQKTTQVAASLDSAVDKILMKGEKAEKPGVNKNKDEDEEETPGKKKLNVEEYARNVARLLQHYDSLLDVPNTIWRRAINYVVTNYDRNTAAAVKEILVKEYQVGPEVPNLEYDVQAPNAERSGAGGGGGTGG